MIDFLNKKVVLFVGVLFHVAFLMSIFDIYFVSPLTHGMKHWNSIDGSTDSPSKAPAQRLFLIVGDGLRADKCFDTVTHPTTGESGYLAPFIREKVMNDGTFGVSHTRMPTESRPGHVALIAGFYEDVSAVTKGWKENPVNFDSVFNQSRHTYSYGSPDILPMFSRGASDPDRVDAIMYGHEYEDFTKSSIELDKFVFDHLDALFEKAASNKTLEAELKQDKIVFFLHLLGIDTAGHSYRPYSAEYYDNIKYIDTKISALVKKVENFYNDGQTAWVFTADHGMSDWGSHGDGHPDNTRTPIVAWGAGVAPPIKEPIGHDDFSTPWKLDVKRNDINQADVASLMSYLVGLNYPANSVGELPLDFLSAGPKAKANALYANAMGIIEQYLVKEFHTKTSHLNFIPFAPLSDSGSTIEERQTEIRNLIESGNYQTAIEKSEELMKYAIKGLRYLQTYNWLLLRSLVTLGYIGWIGYSITSFFHVFVVGSVSETSHPFVTSAFVLIFAVISALFYKQNSPVNFYLYGFFPVIFWHQIFVNRRTITKGFQLLVNRSHSTHPISFALFSIGLCVAVMEAIVVGYFNRKVFSLCFVLASAWPWIQNRAVAKQNVVATLVWAVLCFCQASFTLLPANKVEDLTQIMAAGWIMVFISSYFASSLFTSLNVSSPAMYFATAQIAIIVVSTLITRQSVLSLSAKLGLPLYAQVVGWLCMVLSLIVPFSQYWYPEHSYKWRLLTLFMAFAPTFIILTISYEGLFYISFFAILMVWLYLENQFSLASQKQSSKKDLKKDKTSKQITFNEIRISLFFFYLSQVAFFGTGNIASISSFSLDSVYRLIPIFDPFSMGALLLFKILAPFVVLSCTLGIINFKLGVPKSALFAAVLALSDVLTLNFFYLVVDEGSWLDIGMGISHFSIASLLCLFMIVLEYLSGVLVQGLKMN